MSTPDPLTRLRGELRHASDQVRLAPGSELAAIRGAHRRRNRTRAAIGATAVVAVGATTTVAIQQLGKTSPGNISVGESGGTVPDQQAPPDQQVAPEPGPTTTTVRFGPAGTVPGGMYVPPEVDAQPAVAAESHYTWNAMTPESAETLGSWRGQVPGVIIATAPGRSADPTPAPQAYYTADGISFDLLDIAPVEQFNPGTRLFADGDAIYRVGTAPGVAEDAVNPLLLEVSTDRGATWGTVDLPLDTHELRQLPYVTASHWAEIVPTDAGPLLLVTRNAGWDFQEFVDQFGRPGHWEPTADGFLASDGACAPEATSPPATVVNGGGMPDNCATRLYTWDELEVPAESVAAMANPQRTFTYLVVDGLPVEVPVPEGVAGISTDGYGQLFGFTGDGPAARTVALELAADGTWITESLPDPLMAYGGIPQSSTTHRFTMLAPQGLGGDVLATSEDGDWWYTDLTALFDDFALLNAYSNTVTADGFAAVTSVRTDRIAEQGGVATVAGSVTITRPSEVGGLVVTDTATGAVIEGWSENWVSSNRGAGTVPPGITTPAAPIPTTTPGAPEAVEFLAADGTVLATLSVAEYEALYGSAIYDESPDWSIVTTVDGVNIAEESVADLLGVAAEEISSARINSVDRKLIVTVTLTTESSPGVKQQMVLLGTPNE